MNQFSYPGKGCSPDQSLCPRSHVLPLLLLVIILSVIYANSFGGSWVFDDTQNIVQNSNLHLKTLDWESVQDTFHGRKDEGISRPLSYLSLGLNYYFHGLDTWGYHLVNFIIHCLTTLFVYLFIYKTLHLPILDNKYAERAGSIALLATVLWATSPMQVTAVTYIVQRMASMAAMFFIISMFFYLLGRTSPKLGRRVVWFALCALSGVLAVASKENAALLPVLLYLFDLLLIQGVSRANLKRHLLIGAVPLLFLVGMAFVFTEPFNILSGYANRDFTVVERLLTQPRILIFYLSLLIYPMPGRFALIHEVQISTSLFSPWTTLPAIAFWVAWIGLGIYLAKRRPLLSFCLLFFVITHLVESSFIPLELIYEHRNYLPSMALFLLLGVGVVAFIREFCQKRLLYVLTSLVLVVTIAGQGHTVINRNALFEHPLYLWADNAKLAPGLSRVHTNLGKTYAGLGLHEKAKEASEKAIEVDRYHRPDLEAVPYSNLGNYYLRKQEPEKALDLYKKALEIEPGFWRAWPGMTSALLRLGEVDQARKTAQALVNAWPEKKTYQALYGLVLLKQGTYEEAVQQAVKALEFGGEPGLAHKVLGEAFYQLGREDKALKYWQEYAQARPKDMEAWLAVVRLAHDLGRDQVFRRAAVQVLSLKGERTWEEVVADVERKDKTNELVLTDDPRDILPLVRLGVEREVKR
ncbi:MAG: tetratricopeptide repeat protein [Thermodesulfobacteriota bacterium]